MLVKVKPRVGLLLVVAEVDPIRVEWGLLLLAARGVAQHSAARTWFCSSRLRGQQIRMLNSLDFAQRVNCNTVNAGLGTNRASNHCINSAQTCDFHDSVGDLAIVE